MTDLNVVIADDEIARLASLAADTADDDAITLVADDPTVDRIILRRSGTDANFAKVQKSDGSTTHIRDVRPDQREPEDLEQRIRERLAYLEEKQESASNPAEASSRRKRMSELRRLLDD